MTDNNSVVNFRPSKAPGFMQCPGYCMEPERSYKLLDSDKSLEFATLGTACHDVFSSVIVKQIKVTNEILVPFCEKYNVPFEGFMGLARKAYLMEKKWNENLAQFFSDPVTERKLKAKLPNGYEYEGTPDIYQLNGDYALILDLKSGETDLDYKYQLMTYCLLLYRQNVTTGLNTFYCYIWSPVIDSYNGFKISEDDLLAFEKELCKQFELAGKQYKSGPWCSFCDMIEVCPSHRRAFLQLESQVPQITVEQIATTRPIIKAMQKIIDLYDATEKALLEKYGKIPLGDGHELYQQTVLKDTLDAPKALQILMEDFSIPPEKIGPHMKLSKTAVTEVASENAPPRGKTKYTKLVIETLRDKGAITEVVTKKRQVRRINQEIEAK
jgi:hypothetical protein